MSESLCITILGDPQTQPRPRAYVRGKHAGIYNPNSKEKATVEALIHDQRPDKPLTDPLDIRMLFWFKRPGNHFGSRKGEKYLKDSSPHWRAKKPDIDNVAKFYMDVMNTVFFEDDAQVVRLTLEKRYVPAGDPPMTIIYISQHDPQKG